MGRLAAQVGGGKGGGAGAGDGTARPGGGRLGRKLALAGGGVGLILGVLVAIPSGAATSAAAQVATPFTPAVGLPGGGAEPSIRAPLFVRSKKTGNPVAYVTAPTGANSNFWSVSEAVNPDGSHQFVPSAAVNFDNSTGGGDADVSVANAVDPTTGCAPLAVSGLHNNDAFANFTTAMSSDCGKTFTAPNLFSVQNVADDRQWQAFDGAHTNFLIYHKVDTGQIVVSRSLDAGKTYTSLSPSGQTGIIDSNTMPSVVNSSQIGNVVTDYSRPVAGMTYPNGDQVHTLWAIFEGPNSPSDNAAAQSDQTYNHNDTVYIARSDDGGNTWTDKAVFGVDPTTKRELNILFPVVAVDQAGNVFAAWSDQFKVQYVASSDGGATWTQAYQVNEDNLGTTPDPGHADVMPWIVAGRAGSLDIVWYHGEGGNTTKHRDPGDASTVWTVGYAELFGANKVATGGVPTPRRVFTGQDVSGVIHVGDVCQNGTLCISPTQAGDRTLLDYFEVALDSAGRAIVAFASDKATPGTATVEFIRQNGGLSATTGRPVRTLNFNAPPVNPACVAKWTVQGDTDSVAISPGMQNPQLDLMAGDFALSSDQKTLRVLLTLANLSKTVPAGAYANEYYSQWSINGTTYFAHVQVDATGAVTYHDGTVVVNGPSHLYQDNNTDTGVFGSGPDGVIEVDVPLTNVNLTVGSVIPQPSGLVEVEIGGPAGGSLQQADTGGPQYDATVGAVCPT